MIVRFDIATNGSGAYTGTKTLKRPALLHAAQWVDGDLADGVDAVLKMTQPTPGDVDTTLLTLTDANVDLIYYPRQLLHSNVGANLTAIYDRMLVDGLLTLTVASGGATKTGALWLYLIPLDKS